MRKPVLATIPGPDPVWNALVDDVMHENPGSIRDLLALLRAAKGRKVLILNGAIGRGKRYRDLVFAILVKYVGGRTPILIHDATWEPSSRTIARRLPWLTPLLPRLARTMIRLLDGPHVRYVVLSTDEVRSFPGIWGVDPERVLFQPFPNTLFGYGDTPTADHGYLFAGGNSMRDYRLLGNALDGLAVPCRMATSWTPTRPSPHLMASPTSHDEFMTLMARCHAAVVPLVQSVRSAGQQTYLNAMAFGKPVIVTEAAGVRDYIVDGETGVIVPPRADALRAAILHVMDPVNADLYRRMGEHAQEDVAQRFTEQHYRRGLLRHAGILTAEEATRDY